MSTTVTPSSSTPAARYFRDRHGIWRFSAESGQVRLPWDGEWEDSICLIQDMEGKEEITAEEGEP